MSRSRIHHYAEAGMSQRAISERIGCSERAVRGVLSEAEPTPVELSAGRLARRGAGAPSKTAAYAERVQSLLRERPSVPTREVLRQARGWGYAGGDSAFFTLVQRLRPAAMPVEPLVPFDGLPGEFAQFDFGEALVTFTDGTSQKFTFFAGCLKYSRMKHVVLTPNQQAESLIRATVDCLHVFGGAPKQWVFDNPKTVWTNVERDVLHPYLAQACADLRALVERSAPRRGNQKGAVENLVGFVKKNFFFARAFTSRVDLERQLAEWLRTVNHERPSDATGEIPIKRLEQELPRLTTRRVPWTGATFPLRESAIVRPTGAVLYRGTGYSVDPRFLGATATLRIEAQQLTIEIGTTRCTHAREDFTDQVRRLPGHSVEMAARITAQRKQTYFKRQCLLDLGPSVHRLLDRLIMGTPGNDWYRDIHRLFELYERDAERFIAAVADAVQDGRCSVAAVEERLRRAVG